MKNLRQFLPDNWGLVFSAFAAAYGVGLLPLLALPFLISAIMNDLKLDAAQAGFLMSAEFVFTMLASLVVAPAMGRAPRRTLALGGAVLVIGRAAPTPPNPTADDPVPAPEKPDKAARRAVRAAASAPREP